MSKHEKFTAPETIETIALSDLYLSDLNPRQHVEDEEISVLADSLVACGLMQNLSGLRDKEGKVGIVAGGRRFRALNVAVLERSELANVPVKVTENAFLAEQWAVAENAARQDLNPIDEVRAYGNMAAKSMSVAKISSAFCVTEAHVRRRLALSGLPSQVLDAVKAGEISMGIAKAMTVSTEDDKILKVLEEAKNDRWITEHKVKTALKAEAVNGENRKAVFVGQEAYVQAGGTLTADLFEDETLFDCGDMLDSLFNLKLEEEAQQICEAEGWAWVKPFAESFIPWDFSDAKLMQKISKVKKQYSDEQIERLNQLEDLQEERELSEEEAAELEALDEFEQAHWSDQQRACAGLFVYVNHAGKVERSSAYVAPEQFEEAIAANIIKPAEKEVREEKPAYSQKFIDDMKAIRLAAVQTAMLEKPEYVLSLFAFYATPASSYHNSMFGFGYDGAERNKPEIEDNFKLDPRLGGEFDEAAQSAYEALEDIGRKDRIEGFKLFRDLGKKLRNGEINAFLARRFKTQSAEFMANIEAELGADMRLIWTPSETNCFKRLKADQLNAIYKDLLDLEADSDALSSFEKQKKGQKNEDLHKLFHDADYQAAIGVTEDQLTRINAWLPDCF